MIILVPSYKRAGEVLTRRWLHDAVLCVHEFEYMEYRDKEGGEIVTMPDNIRGNMARIRNWMLDYGFSKDDHVVMMDDDIVKVGYRENGSPISVDEDYFMDFLKMGFEIASGAGSKLWGVNVNEANLFYYEWLPISVNVPVLGTLCCHIKNDLRYDESLSLNEDYDFFLQHCFKYRKVLRFDKWHYIAKHLDMAGGCAAYRTIDEEKYQSEIMIHKWGNNIVKYDFKKSTNPTLKVPF